MSPTPLNCTRIQGRGGWQARHIEMTPQVILRRILGKETLFIKCGGEAREMVRQGEVAGKVAKKFIFGVLLSPEFPSVVSVLYSYLHVSLTQAPTDMGVIAIPSS